MTALPQNLVPEGVEVIPLDEEYVPELKMPEGVMPHWDDIRAGVKALPKVPDDIPEHYGVPPTSIYEHRDRLKDQADTLLRNSPMGMRDPEVRGAFTDLAVYEKYHMPSLVAPYEKKFEEWKASGLSDQEFQRQQIDKQVRKNLPFGGAGYDWLPVRTLYDLVFSIGKGGWDVINLATANDDLASDMQESFSRLKTSMAYQDQFSALGEVWGGRVRNSIVTLGDMAITAGATGGVGMAGGAVRGGIRGAVGAADDVIKQAAPTLLAQAPAKAGVGEVGKAVGQGLYQGAREGFDWGRRRLVLPSLATKEASSTYADFFDELRKNGKSAGEARVYSGVLGALTGLTTMLTARIPGLGNTAKTMQDMVAYELKPTVVKILGGIAGEELEENAQTFLQEAGRALTGIDPEALSPEKLGPKLRETLIQTAMTAGLAEGIGVATADKGFKQFAQSIRDLQQILPTVEQSLNEAGDKYGPIADAIRPQVTKKMEAEYGQAGRDAVDDLYGGKQVPSSPSRSAFESATGRKGPEYGAKYRQKYIEAAKAVRELSLSEEADAYIDAVSTEDVTAGVEVDTQEPPPATPEPTPTATEPTPTEPPPTTPESPPTTPEPPPVTTEPAQATEDIPPIDPVRDTPVTVEPPTTADVEPPLPSEEVVAPTPIPPKKKVLLKDVVRPKGPVPLDQFMDQVELGPTYGALWESLKTALSNQTAGMPTIEFNDSHDNQGSYYYKRNRIVVNDKTSVDSLVTIFHEAVHAATKLAISANRQARRGESDQRLRELNLPVPTEEARQAYRRLEQIADYLHKEGIPKLLRELDEAPPEHWVNQGNGRVFRTLINDLNNSLANAPELIAETLSNPQVAEVLRNISVPDSAAYGDLRGKNVLEAFIGLIKELLGIKGEAATAFDEVVGIADTLMLADYSMPTEQVSPTDITTESAASRKPPLPGMPQPFTPQSVRNPGLGGPMKLRPLTLEDMVTFQRELVGSVPHVVQNLRGKLSASARQNISATKDLFKWILINGDIGQTELMSKALAHELGKLSDWIDAGKAQKSQILSRIGNFTGKKARRNFLAHMKKQGIDTKMIRRELIALSEWWSPYDRTKATASYIKMRESTAELFGEMFSVLLNSPGHLAVKAPQTFGVLMSWFHRRPKVVQEYLALQHILDGTPEQIAGYRAEQELAMYSRADTAMQMQLAKAELEHMSLADAFIHRGMEAGFAKLRERKGDIVRAVFDMFEPITKYGQAMRKLEGEDAWLDMQSTIDDFQRSSAPAHLYAMDLQKLVEKGEDLGISREQQNQIFSAMHVILAGKIANPRGETTGFHGTAMERLKHLRATLGKDLFSQAVELNRERARLWKQHVLTKFRDAQMITPDEFRRLSQRPSYVPHLVVSKLQGLVSPAVLSKVGTFEDVVDPITATLMKGSAMIVAAERNIMSRKIIEVMERYSGGAELRRLKPSEKPNSSHNEVLLTAYRWKTVTKGRGQAARQKIVRERLRYAVPKEVKQMLDGPHRHALTTAITSGIYQVWYPLYITFRAGFLMNNVPRDLFRNWWLGPSFIAGQRKREVARLMQMGHSRQQARRMTRNLSISLGEIVKGFIQALPAGFQYAIGNLEDARVRPVLEARVLDMERFTTGDRYRWNNLSQAEMDQFLRTHGVIPDQDTALKKAMGAVRRSPVGQFYRTLARMIDTTEAAAKISGYELAKKKGLSDSAMKHMVRNLWGTPNSRRRGDMGDTINGLSMFASVRLANMRAHYDMMRNPATRGRYWGFAGSILFMQAILDYGAEEGWWGEDIQEWWKRIPSHEKTRKWVVPIPGMSLLDSDGEIKSAYFKLAKDPDMAFASAAFRYTILAFKERDPRQIEGVVNELKDQIFGTLAPPWEMAIQWGNFLSGKPPQDSFFDSPVMRESVYYNGGWPAWGKMMGWTMAKFGALGDPARAITQAYEEDFDVESMIRLTPMRSLIGLSNKGIAEAQWAVAIDRRRRQTVPSNMLRANKHTDTLYSEHMRLQEAKAAGEEYDSVRLYQLKAWHKLYEEQRVWIRDLLKHADRYEGTRLEDTFRDKAAAIAEHAGQVSEHYRSYYAAWNAGQKKRAASINRRLADGLLQTPD